MTDKARRVHTQFSQTKDNAIIIHIKNGTKAKLYNQDVMHQSQFYLTSTSNRSTFTQVFQAPILITSVNFNRYYFMQCLSRHRACTGQEARAASPSHRRTAACMMNLHGCTAGLLRGWQTDCTGCCHSFLRGGISSCPSWIIRQAFKSRSA